MDRNVKIALGCGGAGCLGLVVVIVAGVALYFLSAGSRSTASRNYNFNSNVNSRSESPSNANNSNDTESSSSSSPSSYSSSSSLSDDERHRLFHAAGITADADIIQRVSKKIGIIKSDNSPSDDNAEFAAEHVSWVLRNSEWVQSMNTPAKARAYVNAHIND